MKRQVPGLAETARDSRPEIPDGSSSFASMAPSSAGTPTNRSTSSGSPFSSPGLLAGQSIVGSSLLHPKSDVEAGLVPAGLPL